MVILKGKEIFHKLLIPNMASKEMFDKTRAVMNAPFIIDSEMIPEKIPFIFKGAFEHFLEPMTIIAIRNITVKMECKLKQGGKLKAVKSTKQNGQRNGNNTSTHMGYTNIQKWNDHRQKRITQRNP